MKNKHSCSECGNEIIFIYETPSKVFSIENGSLVRSDNNITDNPELTPYCSYDKAHIVEPQDDREFWDWVNEVEMYFKDRGLYE